MLENYQLRVTSSSNGTLANPTICDPSVKQYSGYLDISDDRHLFFWFFEARNLPETAPLLLWLNGGPGCSSSTGLLMELGPCRIAEGGLNTTVNEFSWNTNFNIIFLDQPAEVGYSYRTGGDPVITTPEAAVDVYAMLQLFLERFPQYRERPFHIAAESYGGRYAPSIASVIYKRNQDESNTLPKINLKSIAMGNGVTEPKTQFTSDPEFACEGPYALWEPDSPECKEMRHKAATCDKIADACYLDPMDLTCVPATLYCWSQMYNIFDKLGLNGYDVRRPCDKEKYGNMCYPELTWIKTFLNLPETKAALGAEESVNFEGCNQELLGNFLIQGDMMMNTAELLPELLNAGLRVLVYAGNADFMCNFIGNERWMERLEGHALADDFARAVKKPWSPLSSGKVAGKVRASGGAHGSAGNFTFLEIHEAGHMAPYDQPEATLDMIER
ncbi:peptidase S10, serine carboxypeptidase [Auricularia subglabra TFB-10046 SS5]|nr:peptidase S10, serine carboxypeptidase [Auricularia subglabra TFB-10046 SS5]